MKTKLSFGIAICLTISIYSQNVWTGNIDDLWSNADNWSGNVPDSSEDVLIPPGFTVTLDTPANIRSIEVQGNSTLNITESLIIAVDSEFEDNVVVNWSSGDLVGPGILLNSGTINLTFPSFDLTGSVVLNNPGEINISNGGNIGIGQNCVLNNSGTGIIDFQSAGSVISGSTLPTTLNNFGTIKVSLPLPGDAAAIGCQLINTDGVFQIDSGTLNMNAIDANFMGGEFNISSGATMNWNDPIDAIGVFSGVITGELNWLEDLVVTSTAAFNFTGNNTINNTGGDLLGGGTLTNLSTINIGDSGSLAIQEASTLENEGLITLTGAGDLLINANGTVNNNATGIISLLDNGGNISSISIANDTRVLNNEGLIEVTLPNTSDEASIFIKLNNNNGQIDVNNGRLSLNYGGISLTNGLYNIDTNGTLNWSFPLTLTGTMTGNLNGILNWDADLIVPTTAAFNFSGNGIINWESNDLDGGGVFTNENTIIKTAGGRRIENGTTLNNNGTIRMTSGGQISVTTNSILNNNATGLITFEASTSGFNAIGAAPNVVNNFGNIECNVATGVSLISAQLVNSGTIDVIQNGLTFTGAGSLTNISSGIIKGNGTLTLTSDPNDFVNNGTFAPGASPGILNLVNEFNSSSTSNLQIELNGLDQGVTYDLLSIDGDANLDGGLEVILDFSPSVNDEFVILTTSGGSDTINQCDLPNTLVASFGGFDYEFSVECRNNEELVLTVTNETLSISNENEFIFNLYPNPTKDFITIIGPEINGVMVYDINGREVLKTKTTYFSIESLENGVYFVKAQYNNRVAIRKVIKH